MGAESFHVDRRTEEHDETNSRVSQFFERAYKDWFENLNVREE
jgi:hypothetical protein